LRVLGHAVGVFKQVLFHNLALCPVSEVPPVEVRPICTVVVFGVGVVNEARWYLVGVAVEVKPRLIPVVAVNNLAVTVNDNRVLYPVLADA